MLGESPGSARLVSRLMSPRSTSLLSTLAIAVATLAATLATQAPSYATEATPPKNPPVEAPFTIASYNVLGFAHTAPGGSRRNFADGYKRTSWAIRSLENQGVDVVGLQEFQPQQYAKFLELTEGAWQVYRVGANSVAWRTRLFELVAGDTVTIPYFDGVATPQPVVRLRSKKSGQEIVVISVHNPADARGPAQKWRNKATRKEIAKVAGLRSQKPRVPIFMTGDMNDREKYFCPFTESGAMHAAAGGSHTAAGGCVYPSSRAHGVDWIFGSKGVSFAQYAVVRSKLVQRTSDHPLIVARAR